MTANFPACLAFVLAQEGGWSDNPKDPGGATMKGITLATFRTFKPGATKAALRKISDQDVEAIYRTGYWLPIHGDGLPSGVDVMCFDFSVNAGPARAAKHLQGAVGVVEDGVLGPISMAAIAKASVTDVIAKLSGSQRAYYRSLSNFDEFGRGWLNRTDRRMAAALKLAAGKP